MIEVGRVVIKIAGRDAGKAGVVIGTSEGKVLLDGEVRRREVAIAHVEPTAQTVDVAEGASTDAVRKALVPLGYEFSDAKTREHKAGPKPVKQRASEKKAAAKPKKTKKAASKKSDDKKDEKKPTKKKSSRKKSSKASKDETSE